VCFCCVGFFFLSTRPRDWLERTSQIVTSCVSSSITKAPCIINFADISCDSATRCAAPISCVCALTFFTSALYRLLTYLQNRPAVRRSNFRRPNLISGSNDDDAYCEKAAGALYKISPIITCLCRYSSSQTAVRNGCAMIYKVLHACNIHVNNVEI